jgi:hypothetical protein
MPNTKTILKNNCNIEIQKAIWYGLTNHNFTLTYSSHVVTKKLQQKLFGILGPAL